MTTAQFVAIFLALNGIASFAEDGQSAKFGAFFMIASSIFAALSVSGAWA